MKKIQNDIKNEALALIAQSGVQLTSEEKSRLRVIDFGLGDNRRIGVQYIDIACTGLIRVAVLALLSNQTLPEHVHPPYDTQPGKEETVRCVWGEFRVYLPGAPSISRGAIPAGNEQWYTARREVVLNPPRSVTISPREAHWFQAGEQGAVVFTFQNRVDESRNVFTDPLVGAGCLPSSIRTA